MKSEARKVTGESLLDHMQVFARGDIKTVMTDLITSDKILWRSSVAIPATSVPGEELRYLTHYRVFACLPEVAGYRKSHWRWGELARRRR